MKTGGQKYQKREEKKNLQMKVVGKGKKTEKRPESPEYSPLYPLLFPNPEFALSSEQVNSYIFENFNYSFQRNRLVSALTGESYVFSENYESLGTFVSMYVQSILLEMSLLQTWIPFESPSVNIFHSVDAFENSRLLVIIQGSGKVRPGQWSRSVCINDSLEAGSMFSYIVQAINLNYGILILNPNLRRDPLSGKEISINSSSISHCNYVWETFVKKSKASQIFIAAHSYGGVCTVNLLKTHGAFFKKKVKAIALLDSVHKTVTELSFDQRDFFKSTAKNWKKSQKPLGTVIPSPSEGCPCVSAGDTRHEYTSYAAQSEVFIFFTSKSNKLK
jgi:hypothetical protein